MAHSFGVKLYISLMKIFLQTPERWGRVTLDCGGLSCDVKLYGGGRRENIYHISRDRRVASFSSYIRQSARPGNCSQGALAANRLIFISHVQGIEIECHSQLNITFVNNILLYSLRSQDRTVKTRWVDALCPSQSIN